MSGLSRWTKSAKTAAEAMRQKEKELEELQALSHWVFQLVQVVKRREIRKDNRSVFVFGPLVGHILRFQEGWKCMRA